MGAPEVLRRLRLVVLRLQGVEMIAAVLCGGKGTRLRSVIGEHQKCAVDVGGKPWIHRVLDELHEARFTKVVLLTGFMADEIVAAMISWHKEQFVWASEAARKELRGAPTMEVSSLHSKPSSPEAAIQLAFAMTKAKALLVMNGDTLVKGFDLRSFVDDYETLRLAGSRKSTAVRGCGVHSRDIVDSGIYFRVACATGAMSEFPSVIPFLDIGSPEGLAEARRRFSE